MLSIDIISEILTRLPVKTLCRLRLVCKAWRALISDPDFQQSHRHRSKQNPLLLLTSQRRIRNKGPRLRRNQYRLLSIKHREEENHMSGVSCFSKWRWVSAELSSCQNQRLGTEQNYGPGYYFLRQWEIVPTCLDLVCIHDMQTVYICNPTTRDVITMCQKTSQPDGWYNQKMVAFGYASSTVEYKILRLFVPLPSVHGDYKLGCELISIKIHGGKISCGDCWRKVGDFPYRDCKGDAVVVGGYIHVMPYYGSYVGMARFDYYNTVGVARFDLEQDEWSVIQAPWLLYRFTWVVGDEIFMRELNEKLCVVHSTCLSAQKRLDLWLLENYEQGEWVKQYSIDISSLYNDLGDPFIPLLMDEGGRILMNVGNCNLVCYDPRSDETQMIREEKKPFTPGFYVESFISLK